MSLFKSKPKGKFIYTFTVSDKPKSIRANSMQSAIDYMIKSHMASYASRKVIYICSNDPSAPFGEHLMYQTSIYDTKMILKPLVTYSQSKDDDTLSDLGLKRIRIDHQGMKDDQDYDDWWYENFIHTPDLNFIVRDVRKGDEFAELILNGYLQERLFVVDTGEYRGNIILKDHCIRVK